MFCVAAASTPALVSIMVTRDVVTSQQIPVTCDVTFDEVDFSEYDYVVLPGGLPGAHQPSRRRARL